MAISQQWRHASLLMLALAVLFIGSAEATTKCPSGFKDCNKHKPGCETCVAKDVKNCGDCGKKCKDLPYTVAKCVGGQCKYTCKAGRCNCDNNIHRNGCETDSSKDVKNCGGCGKVCKQVPYAETKCLKGKCCEPVCKAGWANCDKNIWSNGCETDTSKDAKNCGACGNVCKQVANAFSPSCVNGKCGEPVCKVGWGNCDGKWENGCETPTGEDDANCGACGNASKQVANSGTFCENGICSAPSCRDPYLNCDEDLTNGCETNAYTDVNNCFRCGIKCPSTIEGGEVTCIAGVCGEKCPDGSTYNSLSNSCESGCLFC